MPRTPRVDFPGAYHHVFGRGIEKRVIFTDDQDRKAFLKRLGENLQRWNLACFAWALMPNHFHLMIHSRTGELPSCMRCLLTGYSLYFNRRHDRVGHLFQNRYQSKVITKEPYLKAAVRYVHLNPVRSRIRTFRDLVEYPWTGHRKIMTGIGPDWQDLSPIREFFPGRDRSTWTDHYRNFIEAGLSAEPFPSEEWESPPPSGPVRSDVEDGYLHGKFLNILSSVSMQCGIPEEEIPGTDRSYAAVDARRQVLKSCVARLDVSVAQICRWLGISEGAGGYLLRSGARRSDSFGSEANP